MSFVDDSSSLEDHCAWPILCTKTVPSDCNGLSLEECKKAIQTVISVTTNHKVEHNINTNAATTFLDTPIQLYKTTRQFSIDSNIKLIYPTCATKKYTWEITGNISEKCTHENTFFYYTNLKDGVCLYKRTIYDVSFSSEPYTDIVLIKSFIGFTEHAYYVPTISILAEEQWILVKDGESKVVLSYPIGGTYSDKKLGILHPTPDPYYTDYSYNDKYIKDEIAKYGIYNLYEVCDYGRPTPDSKTALDGTDSGDMFFPEWCRDRVVDPQWSTAALDLYTVCSQELTWKQRIENMPRNFVDTIKHSELPIGDYAKHPEYGEMYNFLLSSDRINLSDITVLSYLTNQVPDQVLLTLLQEEGIENLKKYTVYYPISLY